MSIPSFLEDTSLKLLLFGGKGGVGKTTCAAATALRFACHLPHRSFVLVSTDPAHSLCDSMAGFLTPPNLKIIELDAQECLDTFKGKHNNKLREIASRGTFLDDDDISQFLDLSLPGLDELMAFLEIFRWVEHENYDCIIVDTAPTGHTLRLLEMPEFILKWLEALDALLAKHRYMKKLFSGKYRNDELDRFLLELSQSVNKMETLLQDPVRCRFVPVMLAETLSIRETSELLEALNHLKIPVTDIIVNRLYPETTCTLCSDGCFRQRKELRCLLDCLAGYVFWRVPLYAVEVCGTEALSMFWERVAELPQGPLSFSEPPVEKVPRVETPVALPPVETTLLLFAGKGGVGKTTMACATAVHLSQKSKGREVFLFSTDPAHSLSACLDVQVGPKPTRIASMLTAMEIDAQAEFDALKAQYAEELERFLKGFSPNLDLTFDREVMERIMDLSPPGLDEVMALTRAMEFLTRGTYDIFILDSAPTGHLIRLLELPELIDQWLKVFFNLFLKYKNVFRLPKISQRLVQMSKDLKRLRTVLIDPKRSALYGVTILTEMAFQETNDLVSACERMGVHVPVLFLNLATPQRSGTLCAALYQRELHTRARFKETFAGRHQTLVYRQEEIRGIERLGALGQALYQSTQRELPRLYGERDAEPISATIVG